MHNNLFKKIIAIFISFFVLGISFSYATSSSSWNEPIITSKLQFSAFLDGDWKVYMNWTSFYKALDVNEDFKYYKVIRSSTVSDPVYPENWYIKYEPDVNKVNYTDSYPKKWVNYYRICAMTYENNRYCSNVVKITVEDDNEVSTTETTSTTSISWWWNAPIIKNELNFSANLDTADGKVYISWKNFYDAVKVNEDFKYYKVVRSQSTSNPVYPDNGYIKYEKDVNKTTYVDSHPKKWVSYYRICAMTYAYNRYCSNVVKVTINDDSSTSETKTSTKLSASLQIRANNTLNKFYQNLERKYSSNEKRLYIMERIITKLEKLKRTKPNLTDIIDFMVEKMNIQKEKYKDDFWDLENIFEDF